METTTHTFYNEHYADLQRIEDQNRQTSETVRAKNEVDLVCDAVGDHFKYGDSVLDCPSGLGFQSDELARRGLKVTAIDGSSDNIDTATRRNREKAVDFKQGLFKDIPNLVDRESQDAVCCFKESFGYEPTVEENIAHMQSMFDVLKPGGKLVLTWNCTPSFYKKGRKKIVAKEAGQKLWGTDESGKRIGCYGVSEPPTIHAQIVPEEYIPEEGFSSLRGDSLQAKENRTVHSYVKTHHVFIDPDGNEHPTPSFEYREYFQPIFEKDSSGKNAPLGETQEFYDIPLVRALCEHVGFSDVKCVPARKLSGETWTVGMVATKPSLQELRQGMEATRERLGGCFG
mgnify:CR=1 FL=1